MTEEQKTSQTDKKHHKHTCRCTNKKIKNLTSISIVLAGFVVGSLFIDFVQFFAQKGFSAHGLDAAHVITYGDATWVRYDEPRVIVDVVVSDECGDVCDVTDDLLLQLRRFVPTLEAHEINLSTPMGKQYQETRDITELPAFIFDEEIINTAFYREAKILFTSKESDMFTLDIKGLDVDIYNLNTQIEVKEDVTQE